MKRTEIVRKTAIIHHRVFTFVEFPDGIWFADFKGISGTDYYLQGTSEKDLRQQIEELWQHKRQSLELVRAVIKLQPIPIKWISGTDYLAHHLQLQHYTYWLDQPDTWIKRQESGYSAIKSWAHPDVINWS